MAYRCTTRCLRHDSPNDPGEATMPSDLTATPTEPHSLTIADAARLIESRRLSPVELTDTLLERIEALDPQLNAFLLPTPEKAREQAKAAEREIMAGGDRGPPHRPPVGPEGNYSAARGPPTSHLENCVKPRPPE